MAELSMALRRSPAGTGRSRILRDRHLVAARHPREAGGAAQRAAFYDGLWPCSIMQFARALCTQSTRPGPRRKPAEALLDAMEDWRRCIEPGRRRWKTRQGSEGEHERQYKTLEVHVANGVAAVG